MRKFILYLVFAVVLPLGLLAIWVYPGAPVQPVGELSYVDSQNAQIAYYKSGDGPTVVLLASLGRSVSDFNALAPTLNQAGYRTISIESRGVGKSDIGVNYEPSLYQLAADIEAVLNKELTAETPNVDVIGHAFGNRVARAYAHSYPYRVNSIALLASGGAQRLSEMPDVLDAMRGCFKWWNPPPIRRRDIAYAFFADSNPAPKEWMKGWDGPASKLQVAAVANTPEPEWRDAGGIAPILVLQGTEDRIAPAEMTSSKLQEQFPKRVQVNQIEDAGHALLPEAPEAIASALLKFFANTKVSMTDRSGENER